MTEITPTYYAYGEKNTKFVLKGRGFDNIPLDAIGIFANDNDKPLVSRYTHDNGLIYDMIIVSEDTLEFVNRSPISYHTANYLGAIISADRETIYWVNETRPLP